jgi:hypothetical protein
VIKQLPHIAKKNTGLIALGAASFFMTFFALAPASFLPALAGFESNGISYEGVSGTLWKGELKNVSSSGVALGDMNYSLSLYSVLRFAPKVDVAMQGGAIRGEGVFNTRPGGFRVRNAKFDIDLARFARQGILGEPVAGIAQVDVKEILVTGRGCKKAEASVWTDVLDAPVKRFQGEAIPMSGGVACDDADLLLTLSGESADGSAEFIVRVKPDRTYELTATARPAEDDVASALMVFGFERQDGALTFGAAGVLKGVGS